MTDCGTNTHYSASNITAWSNQSLNLHLIWKNQEQFVILWLCRGRAKYGSSVRCFGERLLDTEHLVVVAKFRENLETFFKAGLRFIFLAL